MKKVLSMVLAAMMLLSLCSFAAAEDVVELEFVYHKTEANAIDAMETVINNFNAANPGIKVNFVQVLSLIHIFWRWCWCSAPSARWPLTTTTPTMWTGPLLRTCLLYTSRCV